MNLQKFILGDSIRDGVFVDLSVDDAKLFARGRSFVDATQRAGILAPTQAERPILFAKRAKARRLSDCPYTNVRYSAYACRDTGAG